MRLETAFRISVYLTLALAALCLASADEAFLPGMMLFLIPVEVVIGLACFLEGRWSLTLFWSNLIGLLIAVGSGLWIAWNITSPANQWFRYAPYPVALLPYAAPLVMVLMLAKLFRSRSGPDFWMLHGVGLTCVALACTLADDIVFGVWLLAYLASGLWSLGLHAQSRQKGAAAAVEPMRHWGLALALRRTLLVAMLALAWFLVMPRYSMTPWSLLGAPAGSSLQTGYSPRIDLNYTGPIEKNDEAAFEVYATDAQGQPYLGLNPAQRWRGTTLDLYVQGRWIHRHLDLLTPGRTTTVPIIVGQPEDFPDILPNLGPGQFYLDFNIDIHKANGLFLADPVTFSPDQGQPPVGSDRWRWVPYFHGRDSTFYMPPGWMPRRYRYQQVVLPLDDTAPRPAPVPLPGYHHRLLEQTVPRITTWTREVLNHLVAAGRLTPADVVLAPEPELGGEAWILPQNRDKVARALTDYLASSGEFTYKLEMRRRDFSVDAIEDFLCNVKQGYCEHFATGLVLMLRSVGIPARMVNGYCGAESEAQTPGRQGWYVVRRSQAHSWAEALLPRKGPDGAVDYYWLMLDPSPSEEAAAEQRASWNVWWQRGLDAADDYWRKLILGYTRARQEEAAASVWDRLALDVPTEGLVNWWANASWARLWTFASASWPAMPAVLVLGVGLWFWVRRRRRSRSSHLPVTAVAFYNQFLALIAQHCRLQPLPAQTPREFGAIVGQALRAIPAAADLAALPGEVARQYYRIRFGGRQLAPAEEQAVIRQLHELDEALANRRRTDTPFR
jgi:transglutaminase-like putative cysteine protease